jgi:subtilase family serine protease
MKDANSLADMNNYAFATTITTQLNLCVSLMTACIPCLKPFLDAFDSGMLNVSLRERSGGGDSSRRDTSHGNSYALVSSSRGTKKSNTRFQSTEDENEELGTSASAFAVTAPVRLADGTDPANAIQRTDQWSVRYEYMDRNAAGSSVDEREINEDRRSQRGDSPL